MIRLLILAYGLQPGARLQGQPFGDTSEILSGPAWIQTERYDITAKVPLGATQEQAVATLRNLLAERFGLKAHREMREISGYALSVAKGGPKLQPTVDPDAGTPATGSSLKQTLGPDGFPAIPAGVSATWLNTGADGIVRVSGRSQTIGQLLPTIQLSLDDGKRVVDETGLDGKYDFKMEVASSSGFRRPGLKQEASNESESGGLGIFGAIEKYLGLKLQKTQIPSEVLIIDHLDRVPADN